MSIINSCVVAHQFAINISQRNYDPLQYQTIDLHTYKSTVESNMTNENVD